MPKSGELTNLDYPEANLRLLAMYRSPIDFSIKVGYDKVALGSAFNADPFWRQG